MCNLVSPPWNKRDVITNNLGIAGLAKVMGKVTLPWGLKLFGWIATVTMFVASIGLLMT